MTYVRHMRRRRSAQAEWAARPIAERARPFLLLHDAILDRRDEILDLVQNETGKARRHAFEEVLDVAGCSLYFARRAPGLLRPAPAGRHLPRGHPGDGAAPAQGRGRTDHAVELPPLPGRHRRRARAAGGQRHRAQARHPDRPVDAVDDRPAGRARAAARGLAGRARRARRGRRRAARRRRLRGLHRLHPRRQEDRRGGRQAADRLLAGARRQEPDGGARRRRPGPRQSRARSAPASPTRASSACRSSACTCTPPCSTPSRSASPSRRPD